MRFLPSLSAPNCPCLLPRFIFSCALSCHFPLRFEGCSEGQWTREIPDRQTARVRSYRLVRKMANPSSFLTLLTWDKPSGPLLLPQVLGRYPLSDPTVSLDWSRLVRYAQGEFWTCFLKASGHWVPLSSSKVTHAKLEKGPALCHQNHLGCPGEFPICSALCLWRKTFLFPTCFPCF